MFPVGGRDDKNKFAAPQRQLPRDRGCTASRVRCGKCGPPIEQIGGPADPL